MCYSGVITFFEKEKKLFSDNAFAVRKLKLLDNSKQAECTFNKRNKKITSIFYYFLSMLYSSKEKKHSN